LVCPLVFQESVNKHGALEKRHHLKSAAGDMSEDIHASDERQASVDDDDFLMFFAEIDRSRYLCCEFLVPGPQVHGDLVARQDHGMHANPAVLGRAQVGQQLF